MSWFSKFKSTPEHQDDEDRHRSNTDPETCLEVFEKHWEQILLIMRKYNGHKLSSSQKVSPQKNRSSSVVSVVGDDIDAIMHYFQQMMFLLMEEEADNGCQGPILRFILSDNVMETLLTWCFDKSGEFSDKLQFEQLKQFEQLITEAKQDLLVHKPIIRPLMKLLSTCANTKNSHIETHLVLLLHQLCVCLTRNAQLLELFFDASKDQGPTKFLMFSLLMPYVHREGSIGQQARDALLLIMILSYKNEVIGKYIAMYSDFCPVLAAGLSGLYSSLPRKLLIAADDWYQLMPDDWSQIPELVMFLNSLEFCNAVTQVAHSLVREQLLTFIYHGFLVPVLGPALHQDISGLPMAVLEKLFVSSMDEVIAATAYLDLFLRTVTEPSVIRIFKKFILTEKHDDISILESLITRINSNSRLCMVTLGLFKTLVDMNCEDVMLNLVFRYLIPCNHVMVSQRRAVKDTDFYSRAAEKFLALIPACCHASDDTAGLNSASVPNTAQSPPSPQEINPSIKLQDYETSYIEYLEEARTQIEDCAKVCNSWSVPYDGESPPINFVFEHRVSDTPLYDAMRPVSALKAEALQMLSRGSLVNSKSTENDIKSNSVNLAPSSDQCKKLDTNTTNVRPTSKLSLIPNITTEDVSTIDTDEEKEKMRLMDWNAFLLSLKRVKTPVEDLNSSIEDSIQEMDQLFEEIEIPDSSVAVSTHIVNDDSLKLGNSEERAENTVISTNSESAVQPELLIVDNVAARIDSQQETASICNDKDSVVDSIEANMSTAPNVTDGSASVDRSDPHTLAADKQSMGYIIRDTLTSSDVGPFLSALLTKLESMVQNSLYVNLLLTGLLTRLASYPQPLLRSYLLNHNLVFQPSVKSLLQVLQSIKTRVDSFAATMTNFDVLLIRAWRYMLWREENYLMNIESHMNQSDSSDTVISSSQAILPSAPVASNSPVRMPYKGKKKGLAGWFSRKSEKNKQSQKGPALQILPGGGYRFVNVKEQEAAEEQAQSPQVKNAVYAALVLEEFIKELAAISQEHAVLHLDEGYLST